MFFVRAEKAGLPCMLNTAQIVAIFAPLNGSAPDICKASLDDGSIAEILIPYAELEDIVEAAHTLRVAEARTLLAKRDEILKKNAKR
jgi:hypothetical protein